MFSFDWELMVNHKAHGDYDNAHLNVCSSCLRLDVSSGEQITKELWCLKSFICEDSSDEQGAFYGL